MNNRPSSDSLEQFGNSLVLGSPGVTLCYLKKHGCRYETTPTHRGFLRLRLTLVLSQYREY